MLVYQVTILVEYMTRITTLYLLCSLEFLALMLDRGHKPCFESLKTVYLHILTKGKPEFLASCAPSAVLPALALPSSKMDTRPGPSAEAACANRFVRTQTHNGGLNLGIYSPHMNILVY